MENKLVKISSVVITFVLVVILLSQIQVADVITTLAGIDLKYLLLGFFLYSCSYFFRTLRFYLLLNKEVVLVDLFNIVCVHNVVNNVLPARTGEMSYVYLLKKLHNKKTVEGIATLFVARVFDLITISSLFFISLFLLYLKFEETSILSSGILVNIGLFMLFMILVLVYVVFCGNKIINITEKVTVRFSLNRFNSVNFLLKKGKETSKNFEAIKKRGIVTQTLLFSFFIWISLYLTLYIMFIGMGVNLGVDEVIVGSTFPTFAFLLPIQGLAGFGTFEGAWTLGFMVVGLPKEMAITSGFSSHILLFIYCLILGVFGSIPLKEQYSRRFRFSQRKHQR